MRFRTIALAAGALAAALLLAGCSADQNDGMAGMDHGTSSSSPAPTTGTSDANSADQMFTTMMIPHHEQAVTMADAILGKDGIDERVVTLAQQIKAAQGPEIETMKGWLDDWGTPYDDSMAGHDMGEDGMLSDDEMQALDAATGAEAASLFLTGMVGHHEGAVSMAQTEVDNGQNADVIALAQQVIDGQTREITTMNEILATL